MSTALITGGAGYIGSHTCLELLRNNYDVVVVDNLCNSSLESIKRVEKLVGKKIKFYNADIRNKPDLRKVFSENNIDFVIHFAGLKAVGESCRLPLMYFDVNICGTVALCEVMDEFCVKKMIFSSSATVYGDESCVPYVESSPTGKVSNPYGRTKYMIEEILKDLYASDKDWSIVILRYFNPIGAHESGEIGEDPNGIPNNLVPYVSQVAAGKLKCLTVFGGDYDTPDGTCIRDYIHVVDLANGHVAAINKLNDSGGIHIYNLGTGNGYSVLDIINTFEKIIGKKINYVIGERRDGDIPTVYSDPKKALDELNFKAQFDIEKMCKDSWNWQSKNPAGYKS